MMKHDFKEYALICMCMSYKIYIINLLQLFILFFFFFYFTSHGNIYVHTYIWAYVCGVSHENVKNSLFKYSHRRLVGNE